MKLQKKCLIVCFSFFLHLLYLPFLTATTNCYPITYQYKSSAIDIQHQRLDLKFDWENKQVYGTTTITLVPLQPIQTIHLDAQYLTIHSVKLIQKTEQSLAYQYDKNEVTAQLNITLDRTYQPQESITLEINYQSNWVNQSDPNNIWGSFGKGIRFFEPTLTEQWRRNQIWSLGEPQSNSYWYPSSEDLGDLRTTEFIATVDTPLVVLSNGTLLEKTINKDGTQTFHWQTKMPHQNYQTSFVIGEYIDYKQESNGIPLHNFGYPDEYEGTAASVIRLPDMVRYFSEITGAPYPHPSYSQIFVQDFGGWKSNFTTATITENMVDDKGTHDDFYYLWDVTESEALAQQWFGNYLFCEDWRHIWLNKAFAKHFSGLYNEYKNSRAEFLIFQHQRDVNTYLNDWNSGNIQPIVPDKLLDVKKFVTGNQPYVHGSSVLHMLRKHLGDSTWDKVIANYVKDNVHQLVSTEDLIKVIEKTTGEDIQWFFDQWVYKVGHPIFEVTKNYDTNTKELQLIVEQVQASKKDINHSQVAYFQGTMEIAIDNQIQQVWLEPKASNAFSFKMKEAPKLVNFDYEDTWVKELIFDKTTEEWLYQLEHDKDILGRIAALNQLSQIASNENTKTETKEKIKATFRHIIDSPAYWRLRMMTIWQLNGLVLSSNPKNLDTATENLLLKVIATDSSWVKSSALWFLGATNDEKYFDTYLAALKDPSDRVANAAAIAIGKTKHPKAFEVLIKLKDRPSWKNQSLISTLNGLQQLGNEKATELALAALIDSKSAHWMLATAVWDHRLAAAQTLVALGQAAKGYPLILAQFESAMKDNHINDIFYNALQIVTLADPRGQEVFDQLKTKFKGDEAAMNAVNTLEQRFQKAIKKGF